MSKQDNKELRQQIACEWLEENYLQFGSLRHDVVTDRLQVRCAHNLGDGLLAIGERQETWRNLTDKDINTMVCQCVAEKGVNISTNEMWTALKSDMVPAVHPLRAWLDGLKPYTADQPDWIDMVAKQVHVKNNNAECRINKDNLNNNSYLAQWARTIITASPTLLSGTGEHIYQQSQQLRINNENNYSQASANVGRAQRLFKLSLLIPHSALLFFT